MKIVTNQDFDDGEQRNKAIYDRGTGNTRQNGLNITLYAVQSVLK